MNETEGAKPMSIEHHLPLMQSAACVHAGRIARDLNLPACERADICQDLLLEMVPRFDRFDPGRASAATFVDVLARHAAHAVRGRYRRRAKLSESIPLDAVRDAADLVDVTADVAAHELKKHVQRAVATLPSALRGLVDLLSDERVSEVRRRTCLGHATFYRRLRNVRLHFLAEGLEPGETLSAPRQ
jgi:DNA-directed RNA polymerase specialized sigma24 family protein